MIPATIINDFFESPTLIRDYALSLEFKNKGMRYPGYRTDQLYDINPRFYEHITSKIISVFFNLDKENLDWRFDISFQLSPEKYKGGWAHTDGNIADCAGVVYLSPDAPLEAGTSIMYPKDPPKWRDPSQSAPSIEGRDLHYQDKIDNVDKERDAHNIQFNTTLEVSNVFNRAFIYDGDQWHKENKFFGEGKNARLTLVWFAYIMPLNQTKTPLQRWKTISSY